MEELNNVESPINSRPGNTSQKQIASAVVIAGVLIAGAILLKGVSAPSNGGSPSQTTRKIHDSTAKTIGLDTKDFTSCLSSGKFKDKVEADVSSGLKAGVTGTPSSFIIKNGKVVDKIGGAQPFDKVIEQIKNAKTSNTILTDVDFKPVSADDHITGNPSAQIIIVEYSDLECPYCKVFHKTMQQVVDSNNDVAWVYRHYPIPQLHSKAFREAEATECAWEQGGNDTFWKYTNRIFEITPSNDGLEESEL